MALRFDESKKAYIDESNRRVHVEVGDSKQTEFLPRVKLSLWDNECNVSFGLDTDRLSFISDKDPGGKGGDKGIGEKDEDRVDLENDTIKWKAGSGKSEAHFYSLDLFEGGEDGGYEFEIVLNEKPTSNIIPLTLNAPKELVFHYQPALTPEEIAEGAERPENVVGSYAVYHSSKQGDYSRMGGKNYKTGKAFHIYRPEAVDASGNKAWCELYIDVEGQIATITVPQEFLDVAVYPVVVDPTFGYTSVGGSYNTSNSSKPRLCRFEINIEEAALVDSLTVYGRYQTGTPIYLGTAIYSSTEDNTFPDILLATDLGNLTISSGISQWYTSQIQSILYPSGTYLWLAWWGMSTTSYGFRYFYDASSVHIIAVSNGWPMPFPEASNEENWYSFRGVNLTSEGNRIASIYATYEELPTYAVSLSTSGSGSVEGSGDFVEGESITIYAYPYSYYQFVNWTDDDNNDAIISTDANYTFSMPGYAVNYTANFEFIPRDFTAVWTDTLDGTWDGWAYDIYGNGWMSAELNNGNYVAVHLRFPDITYVPGKRYYLRYINWNWSGGSTFRIVGDKSNGGQLYGHEEYTTRTQTTAEIVTDTGFSNLDITDIVEELAQIQDWNGVIQLFIFPTENTYEGTGITINAGIADVEVEDSDYLGLFAEPESWEDIGHGIDSYFETGIAYFGSEGSAFFRFPALDLPENATITKAEIGFVLYYNGENEGTCEVRIHRVLDDDPISPASGTELFALPLSTEYIDWDVPSVYYVGAMIADVDVTSLYQNPENPVMFIVKENNIDEGARRYVAWAYLKVEYEIVEVPEIASYNSGATSSGTSFNITPPAGVEKGDLVLLFFTCDGNRTLGIPAGWTKLGEQANGSQVKFMVAYTIATGAMSNFTVTSSSNEEATWIIVRIPNGDIPVISSAATGTNNSPDPPNLVSGFPSGTQTLWIAAMGNDYNRTVNSFPATFLEDRISQQGSSTGSTSTAIATLQDTSASQNPGNFGISSSDEWVAFTLAVMLKGEIAEASGGSEALVLASVIGAGMKSARGGSGVSAVSSVAGVGKKLSSGGSSALAEVSAAGAGKKISSGGSGDTVVVFTQGVGIKTSSGGSPVTAIASIDMAGTKEAHGYFEVNAFVTAQGEGTKTGSGGSAVIALATVQGAGEGHTIPSGGSEALVVVEAQGSGEKIAIGASEILVGVLTVGSGYKVASGGSAVVAEAIAEGSGGVPVVGGSEISVVVTVGASGTKVASGGSDVSAVAVVDASSGTKVAYGASEVIACAAVMGKGVSTGPYIGELHGGEYIAQGFKPTGILVGSRDIRASTYSYGKEGVPPSTHWYVYNDNDGVPGLCISTIGYGIVAGEDWSVAGNWVTAEIALDEPLRAGQQYWLVLSGNGTYHDDNKVVFLGHNTDPYADGYVCFSNDGVSWDKDTDKDLAFRMEAHETAIGETPGAWIGTFVDFDSVPSENFNDYTWKKIQGEDGHTPIKGLDYFDGIDGQDGTGAYVWIRYSQNSDGDPMTTSPTDAKYIGIATTTTPSAPTGYGSYLWSLIKGTDGIAGETGSDGQTSYLHIKYSDDGSTFTANNGETVGAWIGTYVDFTQADSTVFSDYTWNRVKGEDGQDGEGVRIFTSTPVPPYEVGDLWVKDDDSTFVCIVARETGSYSATDWRDVSKNKLDSPGYVVSTAEGIKVFDANGKLRVLLGSWLAEALRKYGLQIVGGEIYASYFTTREPDQTDGPSIEITPRGGFLINDYQNLRGLEIWGGSGQGSIGWFLSGNEYARAFINAASGNHDLLFWTYGDYTGFDFEATSGAQLKIGPGGADSITLKSTTITLNASQVVHVNNYLNVKNDLFVDGSITKTGGLNYLEPTQNYGLRLLNAVESPEFKYYDSGAAHLSDGKATIQFDPIFLECIEPDTELTPWQIWVECYGENGVYVSEVGKDYFKVRERNGGTSNNKIVWRFEATRINYTGIRLQEYIGRW